MSNQDNLDVLSYTIGDIKDATPTSTIPTNKGSYLMLKDLPLLYIKQGNVTILNGRNNYLPVFLRSKYDIVYDSVSEWLRDRVIPLNRVNAKRVLNSLRLPQQDNLTVSKACKALSLVDCYWYKDEDDNSTWNDVSLYRNSFSKALSEIAFIGSSRITIQGKPLTPELTGQGSYAKCWVRESDGIYLYKSSTKDGKESESEYISHLAINSMGIKHVKYELLDYYDKVSCRCKLISNEDFSIVPFADFDVLCTKAGHTGIEVVLSKWGNDFFKMLLVDGLLHNIDRHSYNWGFYMIADTGKILGLHPLFDHNCAIYIPEKNEREEFDSLFYKDKTLLEVGIYAYKKLGKPSFVKDYKEWLLNNKKLFDKVFKDKDLRRQFLLKRVDKILES